MLQKGRKVFQSKGISTLHTRHQQGSFHPVFFHDDLHHTPGRTDVFSTYSVSKFCQTHPQHRPSQSKVGSGSGMYLAAELTAPDCPFMPKQDSSHSPSKGAGKKVGNPQLFSGGLQPEMEATGRLGLPPTPPPLLRECRELQNKEIQMQVMSLAPYVTLLCMSM